MAQIRIKQIAQLEQTLNSLTGVTSVVESYSTTATTGNTAIKNSLEARELTGVKVHINGLEIQDFSWELNGSSVTTNYLEAGSDLIFDSVNAGFELQNEDIIKISYEHLANGSTSFSGSNNGGSGTGSTNISGVVDGHLIPDTDEAYDLGSPDKKFRDIYMSGNTLYMGGQPLSIVNGQLTLSGTPVTGSTDTQYSSGQITGTNYPFWYENELESLYGNEQLKAYSTNQEIMISTKWYSTGSVLNVYQIDQLTNTSTIIATTPLISICPNIKDNLAVYLSHDGLSGSILYRDNSYDNHWVLFNVTSGVINSLPDPFPGFTSDPGTLSNTFIRRQYGHTENVELAKWNGSSYDYQTIFDTLSLFPNSKGAVIEQISTSGDVCTVFAHDNPTSLPASYYDGTMFILRYDGLNWNVEFTTNDAAYANVINGMTPTADTIIYSNNSRQIVTLKYQSGVWNTVNTMTTALFSSAGWTSISVNGDLMQLNRNLFEWTGSQWDQVTTSLINPTSGKKLFSPNSESENHSFSHVNNFELLESWGRMGTVDTYDSTQTSIQIPSSFNSFTTNAIYHHMDIKNYNWKEKAIFYMGFVEGTPNTHPGTDTVEYTFNDTLSYRAGDLVLFHTDNFELMWKMQVLNNDTSSKTLTLIPMLQYTHSYNYTSPGTIYTNYNIRPL